MDKKIIQIMEEELTHGLTKKDVIELLEGSGYDKNDIEQALIGIEQQRNTREFYDLNDKTLKRVAIVAIIIVAIAFIFFGGVFDKQELAGMGDEYIKKVEQNNSAQSYAKIHILPRQNKTISNSTELQNINQSSPSTNLITSAATHYEKGDIDIYEYERNNYIKHDDVGLISELYCDPIENLIKFRFNNVKGEDLVIFRGTGARPANEVKFVYNGINMYGVYCEGKDIIEKNETIVCLIRGTKIRDGTGYDQNGVNRLLVQTNLLNDNTEFRCA